MKVYPDTGHGFLNNHPRSEMPLWALVAGKLSATSYHEASAADARLRIIAFFDAHLREAPSSAGPANRLKTVQGTADY